MSCVFLCYLTKAAIYFIIFLHTVNLQRQTVKLTLQLVLECLQAPFLPDSQALRRHAPPDGGADVSLSSPLPSAGQGTDEYLSHLNQGEQISQMSQSSSPRTLLPLCCWQSQDKMWHCSSGHKSPAENGNGTVIMKTLGVSTPHALPQHLSHRLGLQGAVIPALCLLFFPQVDVVAAMASHK